MFLFFKQKPAYEMRISDWSSDVCSSDLCGGQIQPLIRLDPVAAADGPVVLIKDQRLNSLVAPVPVGTGISHEPVDREGAHIPAKLEPEPLLDLGEAGIIAGGVARIECLAAEILVDERIVGAYRTDGESAGIISYNTSFEVPV